MDTELKRLKENNSDVISISELKETADYCYGVCHLKAGKSVPFLNGVTIDTIGGLDFICVRVNGITDDGNLFGEIYTHNDCWIPYLGESTYPEIGGYKVSLSKNTNVDQNNKIFGLVHIKSTPLSYLPYYDNNIYRTIGGKQIDHYCEVNGVTKDGKLYGKFMSEGRNYPFIGDDCIRYIGGEEVFDCDDIKITLDGKLFGKIKTGFGAWIPFLDKLSFPVIDQKKVFDCIELGITPAGKLFGIIKIEDERKIPFDGQMLYSSHYGQKIIDAKNINHAGEKIHCELLFENPWQIRLL